MPASGPFADCQDGWDTVQATVACASAALDRPQWAMLFNHGCRLECFGFQLEELVMIAASVRMAGSLPCLTLSFDAFAFAGTGHMTVGTIADRLLDGTNAAKQVRAILGSNLRTASVWADCAKGI